MFLNFFIGAQFFISFYQTFKKQYFVRFLDFRLLENSSSLLRSIFN